MSPIVAPPPGPGPRPPERGSTLGGAPRRGKVERVTAETAVLVVVDLDGPLPGEELAVPGPVASERGPEQFRASAGASDQLDAVEPDRPVSTGIPFFDHMLDQLGRHGELGLVVRVRGDVAVDAHHTVEDAGIALGEALGEALGDRVGIRRFASLSLPLDEALVDVALDCSGRPYLHWDVPAFGGALGTPGFDPQLAEEFWRAVVVGAGLTLHVELRRGRNAHHVVEAAFKGIARALHDATRRSGDAVLSTKGRLG